MNSSHFVSLGIIVLVLALVVFRRTRAMHRPIKGGGLRLIMPLLFLLFEVPLYLQPATRPTLAEGAVAIVIGLLISIPMILTTNYERRADGHIYAKRSVVFVLSLVCLVAIRVLLADTIQFIPSQVLTTLLALVACSYLVPWRVATYVKFRRVTRESVTNHAELA